LRRTVARHLVIALTVGWTALLFLVGSIVFVHDGPALATLIAAPFVGLAFWRGNGGGGEPPADDDDGPEPDGDRIDWDDFQRQLDEWAKRPLVRS
jgi:hypothetical protein